MVYNITFTQTTQLYTTFCPTVTGDDSKVLGVLTNCLTDIQTWMSVNFLKFNPHKTEFLVISSPHFRHKVQIQDIQVGDAHVQPSSDARNLGVLFDQSMDLKKHVSNTCRTSYMFLRRIAAIRHLLTTSAAEQLIHAFITSRLDFCNSLLAGLPQNTLHRLQSVQNAAARLLTGTKISSHISPILHNLHWLPIHSRIQYKIILLTFKALHGLSPTYIQNLIRPRSARPGLRSSGSMLYVPLTRLSSYGDRAFSNISPRLWNSLPQHLKDTHDISRFQHALKTHLFRLAFADIE